MLALAARRVSTWRAAALVRPGIAGVAFPLSVRHEVKLQNALRLSVVEDRER